MKASKAKQLINNQRIISNSLQRKSNKSKIIKFEESKLASGKRQKKPIERQKGKITIIQQKTQILHNRKKKLVKQQAQFVKEFEQITKIYQHSHQIQNQQQMSLLCLNQNLDDFVPSKKLPSFNSTFTFNRYSEKSSSQLPSIAEKDVEEDKQEEMLTFRHQKRNQSNLSTASNYPKKMRVNKSSFINGFDLDVRGGSHEKKLTIDVQNLIKSRSKAKSSMSNQSSKAKGNK